jgi:release factor glutamine methyltransferase
MVDMGLGEPGPGGRNVRDVLQVGLRRLQEVAHAPLLEAELLLSGATRVPRTALLAHPEWQVSADQLGTYWRWVGRRADGTPLPYLTGRIEFFGLEIEVTPDVLIPRPETETLVELALDRRPRLIVDVGTGSGCIAIALGTHLPESRVVATDLSALALRVAAANVRRHGLERQVLLLQGDLVDGLRGPVDLVVSNPPYVAEEEWPQLPRSVREFEPGLALAGGRGGLDVVRRLVTSAPRLLRPGGALLIEIGAAQGRRALALAHSVLPGAAIAVRVDLAGRDRVLEVVLPD